MKKSTIYFTPGPAKLYPGMPAFIQKAVENDILSISHRSTKFTDIVKDVSNSLRKLLDIPQTHEVFTLSSASECNERIIQNCVQYSSFHLANGDFGRIAYQVARELNKHSYLHTVPDGHSFNVSQINVPEESELIYCIHTESASGATTPVDTFYLLKKRYPDKLIAVDIVASVPYVTMDYSLIDIAYFSVQKGFGLPAGLAFLIVSPAAMQRAMRLQKKGDVVGGYHNFVTLSEYAKIYQTPETPNMLGIYLMQSVLSNMRARGIDAIRKETDLKAGLLYDLFESDDNYELFVKDKKTQSKTVIMVRPCKPGLAARLEENGIAVGRGFGAYAKSYIRIANYPAHTIKDVKDLIQSLE